MGVTVVGVTMEVTGVTVVTGVRAQQVRRVLPAALWEDGGSLVGRADQALRVRMVEEAVAAELVARVVSAALADGAAAAATASSWSLTGRVVRSWTVG